MTLNMWKYINSWVFDLCNLDFIQTFEMSFFLMLTRSSHLEPLLQSVMKRIHSCTREQSGSVFSQNSFLIWSISVCISRLVKTVKSAVPFSYRRWRCFHTVNKEQLKLWKKWISICTTPNHRFDSVWLNSLHASSNAYFRTIEAILGFQLDFETHFSLCYSDY